MIRLYEEGKFENDNNHGSSVSASTKAEMELMIRSIYKDTICPMIFADHTFILLYVDVAMLTVASCVVLDQQKGSKLPFHGKRKIRLGFVNGHDMSNLGLRSLQLKFLNGISTPVCTGKIIEGNEQKPFLVALVDGISGQIVTTGAEAAMEVEIVVLEGGSNDDEADNWTSDEFKDKIVGEWSGNKVLQGNTFVQLNEGIVSVDKISFTHNSVWKGKRKCRIGARSTNAVFPTRVKEAKTESFLVMDKRKLLYCKHEIPSLSDAVFRLKQIPHGGDRFDRLSKACIKTVMDLLTIHAINPQRLREILNVCPNKLRTILNHAKVCKDDKGIYLYHYPKDGQKSKGVAFNISGQLVGIIAESRFVPCDKLPNEERLRSWIVSSSEHWDEVAPFNDQDALINHLQERTTVNPSFHNNLNVVIPQTPDPQNHTNFTSPKSQSQSPKRPASEHVISNSPKQPRYDHPKLSPSTPSVGMDASMRHNENNLELPLDDDHDHLKYLNLSLRDGRWKIVWCAVGWISMILELRKRRTTFCNDNTVIVIAASMEHAETCD
ncbi:hypothetical protein L1987_53568 [Smallanthus sonchifolius]|uniref:Uncharacterized protein n=1 Tax=Smallanthus sonchifolius TaxID=185202 RepID=A0ACB9EVK7_9ASTR|nr:hypothetical protein L1987_53568 [Smallanthus sonchifolius]